MTAVKTPSDRAGASEKVHASEHIDGNGLQFDAVAGLIWDEADLCGEDEAGEGGADARRDESGKLHQRNRYTEMVCSRAVIADRVEIAAEARRQAGETYYPRATAHAERRRRKTSTM